MNCVTDETNCCYSPVKNLQSNLNKTNEALILTLNDDCLENICKQLPIEDQINFALTCQRFYDVMTIQSKNQHSYINTNIFIDWPCETMKNFLRIVGAHIKHLDVSYLPKQSILDDLSSLCINVRKLKLKASCLNADSSMLITKNMKHLEDLEIVRTDINDKFVKFLDRFKYLKSLSIIKSQSINASDVPYLDGLQKLSINQCINIEPGILDGICKQLRNLRYLDIMHSIHLKSGDCETISKHLFNLETLKLSCFHDDASFLTQMPKLKQLGIHIHLDKAESFFKNLAQSRSNQLEELILKSEQMSKGVIEAISALKKLRVLHIQCHTIFDEFVVLLTNLIELVELKLYSCHAITNAAILKIFENCLKLKRLHLGYCDKLTSSFFKDTVQLLQKQHADHLRQDRIIISGTLAFGTASIGNLKMEKTFSNLCEISFKEENTGYSDSDSELEDDLIWE